MAINIGENQNEQVTYVNSPDINRVLFKNLKEGASKEDIVDAVNDWLDDHPEAFASYVVNTASGAIASFPDGADGVPVKDLVVDIEPVQSGSGDPSPENVRPISGWTGTGVHRTGVNLLGGELLVKNAKRYMPSATVYEENKYVSFAGQASISADSPNGLLGFFHAKENTTYTFIITYAKSSNYGSNMRVVYTDGTYEAIPRLTNESAKETKVVVTNPNKTVKALEKANSGGFTRLYYDECGVFEGEHTIDEFVPYAGQTVDVDWTDEAGTVYGGTLDVTSGVLTVTKIGFDGGDVAWNKLDSSYQYGDFSVKLTSKNFPARGDSYVHVISSAYKGFSQNAISVNDTGVWVRVTSPTNRFIVVKDSTKAEFTAEQFKDAMTGITFVYDLDPDAYKTYQLDPAEVSTLLGQNNIWCDCGNVSVDYRADTKLYFEQLTAPTEDDMVANTNIPNATYFMVGNNLYLSTTTIPAGDTINPGTNCTLMNLASALNAINS